MLVTVLLKSLSKKAEKNAWKDAEKIWLSSKHVETFFSFATSSSPENDFFFFFFNISPFPYILFTYLFLKIYPHLFEEAESSDLVK